MDSPCHDRVDGAAPSSQPNLLDKRGGKRKSGRTGHGDPKLRSALVEAAWDAIHTKDTYLSPPGRTAKQEASRPNRGPYHSGDHLPSAEP